MGWELLDGIKQQVVYVVRDPSKVRPHHFDIEEYEGTELGAATSLGKIDSDDDQDAEHVFAARKAKALDHLRSRSDKAEAVAAFSLASLDEKAALTAEEKASPTNVDDDVDESVSEDDMEQNMFLKALDPFAVPAPKASTKAVAKPSLPSSLAVPKSKAKRASSK